MDTTLQVVETTDGGVKIQETQTYVASKEDVEHELRNVRWHKESLVAQSQKLKKDYDALCARERTLEEVLRGFAERSGALEVIA